MRATSAAGWRAAPPEPMPRARSKTYETIADAAARLGVSPRTIRRRIADGQLTAYRFGPRLIRLDAVEVDAVLRRIPAA